jgi:16S rRNA (guanine527-N7)-methyltransferase
VRVASTTAVPDDADDLAALLERGLVRLGAGLDAAARDRLVRYVLLLSRWNRAYNLTAVRDPARMVTRHLLDSLAILPWVTADRLIDVGTGPGLPGLPLAIARPACRVCLLDANGKKVRFLRQAVVELGLDNAEPVQARVESYRPALPFDLVTSRAFAALPEMIAHTRHLLAPEGRWLAMKGPSLGAEVASLPPDVRCAVETLEVPGDSTPRQLVILSRRG